MAVSNIVEQGVRKNQKVTFSSRRHVFRDLRPYVCLFEHCPRSDHLYKSRHEWFEHERQQHRREWFCDACDRRFPSASSFKQHLTQKHTHAFKSLNEIDVVTERGERATGPKLTCPFCGAMEISPHLLQKHLGRHMQQLSIFVLPGSDLAEEESELSSSGSDAELPPRLNPARASPSESERGSSAKKKHQARMRKDRSIPRYRPSRVLWELKHPHSTAYVPRVPSGPCGRCHGHSKSNSKKPYATQEHTSAYDAEVVYTRVHRLPKTAACEVRVYCIGATTTALRSVLPSTWPIRKSRRSLTSTRPIRKKSRRLFRSLEAHQTLVNNSSLMIQEDFKNKNPQKKAFWFSIILCSGDVRKHLALGFLEPHSSPIQHYGF
jgi:hypothetical protein